VLYFCSLDNAAPTRTTLAEQQAAIAPDGTRARQGLCVDAPGPAAAAAVLAAYLLDCIRSGAPTYAPTVAIEDREGVPVATLAEPGPAPTRAEAAALAAMQARAAARATTPTPTPTPGPSAPAPALCVAPKPESSTPPSGGARPLCFTPEPSNDDASQSDMGASGSAPPV
jgi:hypothetical protein